VLLRLLPQRQSKNDTITDMDFVKTTIGAIAKQLFADTSDIDVTRPEPQFGDYTTNVAMKLAKKLGKNPREVANQFIAKLESDKPEWLGKAEVAGPGFINLTLTDSALYANVLATVPQVSAGTNYVVEYSCPNAFKELHAGHLYQTIAGDVIARMLEQAGSTVHRTNFGGDVGLHVAKAMYGIMAELNGVNPDKLAEIGAEEQAGFLSTSYVRGAKAYEEDSDAKAKIEAYNQQIYSLHNTDDKESAFAQIYWTCRQWSYDYFDRFYERLEVNPFRYIPESTTVKPGLQLVEDGLAKGIFENSEGAVVYKGEKVGLHTRVFVTKIGLPTYEAKDLGVISIELGDYSFDHRILITGRDQAEYMKVVYAAAEELMPQLKDAMTHLTNGLIKFADGTKMSSRLGNVTSATDVLDIVAEQLSANEVVESKNSLMLSAVKYAFLKQRLGGDVAFDPQGSVSLQGNSGPYLQYALVRARSILAKAFAEANTKVSSLEPLERVFVQKMAAFQDEVAKATLEYAPHILCTYLFELASEFNTFYEHNRVLDNERSALRLKLVADYAQILDKGLELLGIERLERM
jgi:arginyl-tRNA synthetase